MDKVRLGVVSLGCPKNLVDTEVLLGKAAGNDYMICADPQDADVVVVNTCGFIDQAKEESLGAIREAVRWKEEGRVKSVVVAGCMAQRYGDEIRTAVPEIDTIIGMSEYSQFESVLDEVEQSISAEATEANTPWRTLVSEDANYELQPQTGRLRVTPRHYAYLKISEGCSNACTFCAIPNFRGLFRSKAPEMVLQEARELVSSGAQELNLISQDTTHYGIDIEGSKWETGLALLLGDLADIEGVRWIRLLYAYPGHVSDELIDALAKNTKVVPYIDMPIQHINSRMLKRMGRRHTREETEILLRKLRDRIPKLVLRTTFIVGFPGETEEEFLEVEEFIKEFRFERLGVFPYSHEDSTAAGENFEDDIPGYVKAARVERLMQTQQEIALTWSRDQIGGALDCVIESMLTDEDGQIVEGRYIGRTLYDAPEVDTIIELQGTPGVEPGTFIEAVVTGSNGYDLIGCFDAMTV
jgi:ribosomal protein S12 methylthiotransferase